MGGDVAVGEGGEHSRELLGRLRQRRSRSVECARSQLRYHARLVLCAALREYRCASREPIDDDHGEGG